MVELLLKQKQLPLNQIPASFKKQLDGVVRFIDTKGETFGLFFDKDAMESLLEKFEYSSPKFWDEIESSRNSGIVSSRSVASRLGL